MEPAGRRAVKLYTSHEHWLICPTHVLWKFNQAACEKPECLRCTLHAKRPPQLWRYTGLLERMARDVDQFVSPSRFTAPACTPRAAFPANSIACPISWTAWTKNGEIQDPVHKTGPIFCLSAA
jgi:hypothetical protein